MHTLCAFHAALTGDTHMEAVGLRSVLLGVRRPAGWLHLFLLSTSLDVSPGVPAPRATLLTDFTLEAQAEAPWLGQGRVGWGRPPVGQGGRGASGALCTKGPVS